MLSLNSLFLAVSDFGGQNPELPLLQAVDIVETNWWASSIQRLLTSRPHN